jgi:hypothetical protein
MSTQRGYSRCLQTSWTATNYEDSATLFGSA